MRLWSLHPAHLDRIGLVAGWREALLAQAVLSGQTDGYKNHPQLERFKAVASPLDAIGAYLVGLHDESIRRGYRFDRTKIIAEAAAPQALPVTRGQLLYEWGHLGRKLEKRSPQLVPKWESSEPSAHPLFFVVEGDPEPWERR